MTLEKKVEKSCQIIKKAARKYPKEKLAVAWTGGKDSTAMLHLIRRVFGEVPFPVVFNDSTMEFPEIYKFIERVNKEWNLELIRILPSEKELKKFHRTADLKRKKLLSRLMKISAIRRATQKYKFVAYMVAIRWDEHQSRSGEKYFSPRQDHTRVHPILHFSEKDIWDYIKSYQVPYVNLYDKGYRSLGEKPFTQKAKKGKGERSGRERGKEIVMRRLRKLGYW